MRSVRRRAAAVGVWVLGAAPAWAQGGSDATGVGLWAALFLGLGAVVVATQAVPAVILLGSLLRSLFAPAAERAGERPSKA
ncbi:MAG: hypothetical protein AB1578_12845 [Thermodesulfobacteriota bacterium]